MSPPNGHACGPELALPPANKHHRPLDTHAAAQMSHSEHPYATLSPETVLDAIETLGFHSDGRILALNSYENRVYQIGLEGQTPVVAKFYRPERWTDDQILEEHAFALELAGHEIPVVAPLIHDRVSLHHYAGFRFAVYPRQGGRAPELDDADNLRWLGRFLGRIHAVGMSRPFVARPVLEPESFGVEPRRFLLQQGMIPPHLESAYSSLTNDLLERIVARYGEAGPLRYLRLHGDCHPGNILWTENGPHFVDLDDARMGPAVQDLWMLGSGDRDEQAVKLGALLEGYTQFCDFDPRELVLIEPLRTLRIMHYAAWLARRWGDPAFPQAFPWFDTPRFWEDHVLSLREQLALLDEPMLEL